MGHQTVSASNSFEEPGGCNRFECTAFGPGGVTALDSIALPPPGLLLLLLHAQTKHVCAREKRNEERPVL